MREVLADLQAKLVQNRLTWARGLQESGRKSFTSLLENPFNTDERCCIGHGCQIFDLPRKVIYDGRTTKVYYGEGKFRCSTAPQGFQKLVGLRHDTGFFEGSPAYQTCLASLNDIDCWTPQEIGQWMEEDWLEGGPGTPFLTAAEHHRKWGGDVGH